VDYVAFINTNTKTITEITAKMTLTDILCCRVR